MADELEKGLEGVLVAESALSHIDGEAGQLVYRGYDIADLARETSYEEVTYLLWHGELPDAAALDAFADEMAAERAVDDSVLDALAALGEAGERPMAALRTGVSMLSASEREADADPGDAEAARRKGRRVVAKIPTLLANYDRLRRGDDPLQPRGDLGNAANFLYMLTGEEPDDVAAETFDMALILHADHGLNASTFTAMVIASTLADVYSSITGGIGALSGSLHGGANQEVMETLQELDESHLEPREWIEQQVEQDARIPGWGHRVYRTKDPRAVILQNKLEDLSAADGDTTWLEYTGTIEEYLTEEVGLLDHGIAPNVDFYSGAVYDKLAIPTDMYTPIFAMARAAGWVGHVLEYQADNRLIRPRARYVGPDDREIASIDER
jgi:citrate synthase